MKKLKLMVSLMTVSGVILVACGNNEEATGDGKEEQEEQPVVEEETEQVGDDVEEVTQEEVEEEIDTEDEPETASDSSSGDDVWNDEIATVTEGDVEVIYTAENLEYETDLDGFLVKVNGYQIVKVTDMHVNQEINFGATDGYVITVDAIYENNQDESLYFNTIIDLQMKDQFDYVQSNSSNFIAEDKTMYSQNNDNQFLYEAGESVNGFVNINLKNEQFEELESINPKLKVGGMVSPKEDFSDAYREETAFNFIVNDEHGEQSASNDDFYQDKLVTNNMAEKEMIYEEEGIDQSESIEDVTVTLEGIQYTELTPTESYEESFADFGDKGIVALTVKLTIDNQSAENIPLLSTGLFLDTDDGRARYMEQGILSPDHPREIASEEADEINHVFLFRKDEFGLYETFSLEYGPFRGEDGKDLFKGHHATFDVPAPE